MPFFEHGNFRMHYEILPGLVPKDTLFIHGNLGANLWWEPTLAALKQRAEGKNWQGRALLAEWRGSGKSSPAQIEAELRMESVARDYLALVDMLQFESAHIVGHSLGGMITLELLCQAPKRFDRAVILNSLPATGYITSPKKMALIERMRADRRFCREVMATTIVNVHELPLEYLDRITDAAFQTHSLNWDALPRLIAEIDIREKLSAVENPLLVVHGLLDHVVFPETSQEIAKLVKNGKYVAAPRAGHSMNVENPKGFIELVAEFLFHG